MRASSIYAALGGGLAETLFHHKAIAYFFHPLNAPGNTDGLLSSGSTIHKSAQLDDPLEYVDIDRNALDVRIRNKPALHFGGNGIIVNDLPRTFRLLLPAQPSMATVKTRHTITLIYRIWKCILFSLDY